MRILALGAHAADQELSAGMILAKYARAGHQVTILSLTAGEKGHPLLGPNEYRNQKVREAKECAQLLGAETRILDYRDAELPVNDEIVFEVCDIIRELKPDLLITHWERSIHKDHRNAHRIALDARFHAGLKHLERNRPAHWIVMSRMSMWTQAKHSTNIAKLCLDSNSGAAGLAGHTTTITRAWPECAHALGLENAPNMRPLWQG